MNVKTLGRPPEGFSHPASPSYQHEHPATSWLLSFRLGAFGLVAGKLRVRQLHDREGHDEQQHRRHDHADERGALVSGMKRHDWAPSGGGGGQETRTEFITSSF